MNINKLTRYITCGNKRTFVMKVPRYYLGQVLKQRECLKHEFKEFCLKAPISHFYERHELYHIVKKGILDDRFNQMIESNLQIYFDDYVPKYASAYSHCKIDKGVLSIGINDFGEITGIPYVGELTKAKVKPFLEACMKKYIRPSPNTHECRFDYLSQVKISIIPLDTEQSNMYLSDISLTLMEELNHKIKIYNTRYKEYLDQREQWLIHLNRYSCNLNKMIRHKKHELTAFIRKHAGALANKIIEDIENNYPISFNFQETDWKENKEHYIYWLFQFKDASLYHLSMKKPIPPKLPKIYHAPTTLMTQLSDLRLKFLNHNPMMKYYVIRIRFPGNIKENYGLEYYQRYKGAWAKRYRTYSETNEPCCKEFS